MESSESGNLLRVVRENQTVLVEFPKTGSALQQLGKEG